MKSRALLMLATISMLLSACTFSLAEDITPPPNYIAPTPMPTLGPLYPAKAPSLENGAVIYTEKCAACHGLQGMGDGAQGKQLPVTVAGLGLPQVGHTASPADWFIMVSRGNIERFMPPFISLNEQERWDVVAYALTLHTTPEQVGQGKTIFESNCSNCALDFFRNQTGMAALSADDLVLLLKSGSDNVEALNGNLSNADLYAAAAYLRSLTFAVPTPTPEPLTATSTAAAVDPASSTVVPESGTPVMDSGTPSMEGTPLAAETATPSAEVVAGKVMGSISGANLDDLTVTLRGFDHASDASGPQETVTLTTIADSGGKYVFDGLDMPDGRIFIAEVTYQGVTYGSDAVFVEAGINEMTVPPFKVYETTLDFSTLAFDQVHLFVEIADSAAQVIGVYTFSNTGNKTIMVESAMEVPFLKMPVEAQNIGFDLTQDSAPLLMAEGGFAMPPSETPYGFVAFYTLPYEGKAQVAQPFAIPASSLLVLVPDGMKLKSDQLTQGEMQTFQGTNFREYTGGGLKSGDTLTFDLSGNPKSTGSGTDSRQNLLIGIGAFGAVLILAGVWMYLRDRNRSEDDELDEQADEFESEEDVLDAIIALDDLHRAGKIPNEAYQARRAELKAKLKNLS